jgi:thermostable 8-oxoguanine DNA glycosylase
MIDPKKVTDYKRNKFQLQEWLLYGICVAGKKSEIETVKLDKFLQGCVLQSNDHRETPFNLIRELLKTPSVIFCDGLMEELSKNKIAPYKQRYNSFVDAVTLLPDDLSEVTIDDLQKVRGIKTKTSRFFLTHSREDFDEPVLDRHINKFLRDEGHKNIPIDTPQNPRVYARVAQLFTDIAKQRGQTVTELDLQVWKQYSYGKV